MGIRPTPGSNVASPRDPAVERFFGRTYGYISASIGSAESILSLMRSTSIPASDCGRWEESRSWACGCCSHGSSRLWLTGLPDLVGVVIGMLVLAGALSVFFLSLFRLHRQMVDAKSRELAIARNLYAEAYEPVRSAPTLDTLDRQRALLGAAEAWRNARARSMDGRSTRARWPEFSPSRRASSQ